MATNLVSLIMQFLTPDIIGRIANGLGLDANKVQSAVSAGVPGLLAGLNGVAATPGGPQKLVDAAKQETGMPANLVNMPGGDGQSSIIARGSQLLGSLLGDSDQNALTDAVGRFSGLGQGSSGSLLGMLAPLVMGTIARQPGSLNPNGMASLLASQKNNIAAALPSGFGKLLGATGLLDSLGGAASDAAGAANQAARTAGSSVYAAGNVGQHAVTGAAARWLWLLPAAAIIAALVYWLNGPAQQAGQQHVASTQNLTVSGIDVGKQASDSLSNLRTTLSGVTDVASAKAALPKLQEVTGQINKTDGMIGSLSAEQRKAIANIVNPEMPAVNQLFDKVLAIPGVNDVLKPTIDTVKEKLATLTA
jgi:Bacterial protein of unknown function (DUF937)